MANVSRAAIQQAVLDWIAAPLPPATSSPFFKRGLRLAAPEQAASPGQPGIYVIKPAEKITAMGEGMPPDRIFYLRALIYNDCSNDTKAIPANQINDLLD